MKIVDIIFPKQCIGCTAWDTFLCQECRLSLKYTAHQRCIVCQKPSLFGYTHKKCLTKYSPDRLISIFYYNQPLVSKIINSSKTHHAEELIKDFSFTAFEFVKIQHPSLHKFTICSIPITKTDARSKGFNHSEVIALIASNRLTLPVDNLLIKIRKTKPQKSLNKQKRSTNLANCFKLKSPESLPESVILIDDVTTTGTTLIEATRVLKRAGIKTVWCLTLAQD